MGLCADCVLLIIKNLQECKEDGLEALYKRRRIFDVEFSDLE